MSGKNEHLDALHDIKQMMERSSRFISLSGLSGIAAGICALVAAYYTSGLLEENGLYDSSYHRLLSVEAGSELRRKLIIVGAVTFIASLLFAFIFTYIRSRKTGVPIWGNTAQRLMWNTAVPLIAGGMVVVRLLDAGLTGLIGPFCLIFYGLALLNGSKYTLNEVRWLGYCQIILGLINLWLIGYGLLIWAIGFGLLHIIYGAVMWSRYEKK
jgi:hypothetical protein